MSDLTRQSHALQAPGGLPEEVLRFLASLRTVATADAYRRSIVRWLGWCESVNVHWMFAQRAHIDVWRRTLVDAKLSNQTVNQRLSAVSSLYRYLVEEEILDRNPAQHITRMTVTTDEAETPALDDHEAAALMAAACRPRESMRTRVAIGILLTMGLRISELVAARVEDLGLVNGQRVLVVTRKGGKRQRIAISSQVWEDITLMLAGRTEGPLLITSGSGPVGRRYMLDVVHRLAGAAKIPPETARKCGPHALRRTAATLLLDDEAPLEDVRDLLGHADARTTQGYSRSKKRLLKQGKHVASLAATIYPESAE